MKIYHYSTFHYRLTCSVEEYEGSYIAVGNLFDEFTKYCHQKNENFQIIGKTAFSSFVRHVFPNVKPGKLCVGKGKAVRVFHNIRLIDPTQSRIHEKEECIFGLIHRLQLPPEFFIVKNTGTHVTVGTFTKHIVNGITVLKEVNFFESGQWTLNIGKTNIDLRHVHIDSAFKRTPHNVLTILNLIKKLEICRGRPKNEVNVSSLGCNDDQKLIIEHWSESNDENDLSIRVRTNKCLRVLQFNSRKSCCRRCQIELFRNHATNQPVSDESSNKGRNENVQRNLILPSVESENSFEAPVNTQSQTHDSVELCDSDNSDMGAIIDQVFPGASNEMKTLLLNQKRNLDRPKMGRRWDKQVIRICLTLWSRNPHVYRTLRDKEYLILPSGRLLQYYKSSARQGTGFSGDVLQWMHKEALSKNIPPQGMSGGIIIDEIAIQDDIQIEYTQDGSKLVGLVDIGEENLNMDILLNKNYHRPLATHVLQFIFLGHTGFRFPFAFFPTKEASAASLYVNVWKAISIIEEWGFTTEYVCMDGGKTNRSFLKMHFENPIESKYVTKNVCNLNSNVVLLMDPKHLGKKLRNNCLSSGTDKGHKRCLMFENKQIIWKHWIAAYEWDRSTNTFPIHHKLSDDHLYLSSQTKMRNHLAEETLNKDMLHLMECYKKSLGHRGSHLDSTIEFLKRTSKLIENYSDTRPITSLCDIRLKQNREIFDWFTAWQTSLENNQSLSTQQRNNCLMSYQTREDLASYILGFHEICKIHIAHTNWPVIPARVNSDIVENIFCQARGVCNGSNTNPTYSLYKSSMSNVILGESVKSRGRKSNAGLHSADPLCFNKPKPLNPSKKVRLN